ncbi:MAG: polysaccharide biosynthesis tyrosine autokinase [Deltaproteobacteria bacterium]|nr:polysaccharide biosynthesis tyrosine autokinase [Deltaproteobacteria bacterium]
MELRAYWRIMLRRRWVLLQAVVIIVGLALLPTFFLTPIYQISAKSLIHLENIQIMMILDPALQVNIANPRMSFAEERNIIDTFMALADINPIAAKVIRELQLTDAGGNLIEPKDFFITFLRMPKLLLWQHRGVRIKRVKAAEVLEIAGYSPDREEAVRIANAIAQEFSAFLAGLYRDRIGAVRQGIEQQLEDLTEKISAAEDAEAAYRVREKLSDPRVQINSLLAERSDLESRLRETDRTLAEHQVSLETMQKLLQKQPGFHKKRTVLEKNPNIANFKDELLESEARLAGALAELTPDHPEVKTLKNRVDQIKRALRQEITKTFSSETKERNPYLDSLLERQGNTEISIIAQTAMARVVARQLAEKDREIDSLVEKQKELNLLSANTSIYHNQYRILKNKLENTAVMESMNISYAVLVQEAQEAMSAKKDLFFPKRIKILVLALLAALPVGLVLIFLLEYLNDTIKTAQEAKKYLEAPLLGLIPQVAPGFLTSLRNGAAPVSLPWWDRFWDLYTNLKIALGGREIGVLAVTSTIPGEGKSTIASHLAATMAQSGLRVLLLEGNLRRPHLHFLFEYTELTPGLTDFLRGEVQVPDIIQPTGTSGLDLIAAGSIRPYPGRLLAQPPLSDLLATLRAEYDAVIVETPALVDGSDAALLIPQADHVLLVLAAAAARVEQVQNACQVLHNLGQPLLGVVFNRDGQ